MEDLTEDRVKTLTHEAITERLDDFRNNFCNPKHDQLKADRAERDERIKGIAAEVNTLARTMNGKFNKLYYFLFVILVGVIMTLLQLVFKI